MKTAGEDKDYGEFIGYLTEPRSGSANMTRMMKSRRGKPTQPNLTILAPSCPPVAEQVNKAISSNGLSDALSIDAILKLMAPRHKEHQGRRGRKGFLQSTRQFRQLQQQYLDGRVL